MKDFAMECVRDKLKYDILEFSQGPYRNRYFLVAKKISGAYRFIKDIQQSKITIRGSGVFSAIDEFSEDVADWPILSAIDYVSWLDSTLVRVISWLSSLDLDSGRDFFIVVAISATFQFDIVDKWAEKIRD
jgi:hypothetical protein